MGKEAWESEVEMRGLPVEEPGDQRARGRREAVVAGTAFAGSYQVRACAVPTPLVNNSWQPFNNNPTYLETTANCGSEDVTGGSLSTSGLAAADVLRLSTNVPAGATAGWQFTPPRKTLVGRVTIVVHYTLGGRSHSVQKTVRLAHGKWLPRSDCRGTLGQAA